MRKIFFSLIVFIALFIITGTAVEVLKLPHGGKKYISHLLGCDFKTIQEGLSDLGSQEELKKNE